MAPCACQLGENLDSKVCPFFKLLGKATFARRDRCPPRPRAQHQASHPRPGGQNRTQSVLCFRRRARPALLAGLGKARPEPDGGGQVVRSGSTTAWIFCVHHWIRREFDAGVEQKPADRFCRRSSFRNRPVDILARRLLLRRGNISDRSSIKKCHALDRPQPLQPGHGQHQQQRRTTAAPKRSNAARRSWHIRFPGQPYDPGRPEAAGSSQVGLANWNFMGAATVSARDDCPNRPHTNCWPNPARWPRDY